MQQSICDWLEARRGIKVQQNWVEACLEWIIQEEGGGVPVASLREMVYEQWLHADLRDVVVQPSIPASVAEQQTTSITGQFVVQVDSLIDVGAAAYAQLQKIKGQSLDDVESKKNFEPKPTRLLLLSLTDGVTDFQGMEYRPIPQLTTDLSPGAKLVLRGTISCRLGTLLLSGDQVEVLGGGVEALAEANQQPRVLARALKDESLATEGSGASGPHTASDPGSTGPSATAPGNVPLEQENETGTEEMEAVVDITDLDLENFDNFEDVEDQEVLEDAQEQWPDDIEFSPLETSMYDGDLGGDGEGREGGGDFGREQEHASAAQSDDAYSTSLLTSAGQKRRHPSNETPLDERYGERSDLPGPSGPGMGTDKRSRVQRSTEDDHTWERTGGNEIGRLPMRKGAKYGATTAKDVSMSHRGSSVKMPSEITGVCKSREASVAAVRPLSTATVSSGEEKGEGGGGGEKGASMRGAPTPQVRGDAHIPTVQSISEATNVWTNRPLARVKARFVKVTSKLTPAEGRWTVAVVLEDSTGNQLSVQLSNQVLEKLIGFSAQEFVEHIQPNKSDPAIRARGSKGFKYCQSYLATLNCLMEIRKPLMFGDLPTVEGLLDKE